MTTPAGASAALVRQALADAINADPTLSALGTSALVIGSSVITDGEVTDVSIDDPGLSQVPPPIAIPALGPIAIILTIATMVLGWLTITRQRRSLAAR